MTAEHTPIFPEGVDRTALVLTVVAPELLVAAKEAATIFRVLRAAHSDIDAGAYLRSAEVTKTIKGIDAVIAKAERGGR